ncbi:RHS repeat-associated core domain-containing protein [Kitasatospora sp. NPDC087861]|uniref:RHS repeat-associated core domain-containing protein n=1 Tax=Kitasatospora sp. NPDC087861 TaxID=3364070 RepID=UPI00382F03D9
MPNGITLVRQGGNLTYQLADPHGTNTLALDAVTLNETRRPVDPFGNPRGIQPGSWAGDHGFVNGVKDPTTGLTNLGAREYQPATGRFLNPDPLLDPSDPQQWNGYSYSTNDPVNSSDPTGMLPRHKLKGPGGRFVKDPHRKPTPPSDGKHGNSHNSTRKAYLYQLRDKAANLIKTGITNSP